MITLVYIFMSLFFFKNISLRNISYVDKQLTFCGKIRLQIRQIILRLPNSCSVFPYSFAFISQCKRKKKAVRLVVRN